jgi:hypothetical protein
MVQARYIAVRDKLGRRLELQIEEARQSELVEEFDRFRTAERQHLHERTAACRPN